MKAALITSLAIFVFCSLTFAQKSESKEQKEVYNTIVLIGNAWKENDLDTLEKYIAKDYVHTDARGQVLHRSEWLGYVSDRKLKGVKNASVEFDDVDIKIDGGFAFVTGANIFSGSAYTNETVPAKTKLRFTQILKREKNVWRRLYFQATYVVSD